MLNEQEKDLINNVIIYDNKTSNNNDNECNEAINMLKILFNKIYLGGEND